MNILGPQVACTPLQVSCSVPEKGSRGLLLSTACAGWALAVVITPGSVRILRVDDGRALLDLCLCGLRVGVLHKGDRLAVDLHLVRDADLHRRAGNFGSEREPRQELANVVLDRG